MNIQEPPVSPATQATLATLIEAAVGHLAVVVATTSLSDDRINADHVLQANALVISAARILRDAKQP